MTNGRREECRADVCRRMQKRIMMEIQVGDSLVLTALPRIPVRDDGGDWRLGVQGRGFT